VISELGCAKTKTDSAKRSTSKGREFFHVFLCTRRRGVLAGFTAMGQSWQNMAWTGNKTTFSQSVFVVLQPSSEIPDWIMNHPVYLSVRTGKVSVWSSSISWFLRYLVNHFSRIYNAKWNVMSRRKEKCCRKCRPLQCARAKYFLRGLKKIAKNLSKLCPFLTGSEPLASRRWIRNTNHVKAVFNGFIRVPKDYSSQIITDSAPQFYLIMSRYKPQVLARAIGFILIFQKEPFWCVQLKYEYYIKKLLII
jgi:hypothetical protein